jgi:hypothetical protein
MTEVICWLVGIIIGGVFGAAIQSRRVVPADHDVEGLTMAETVADARAKLDEWLSRHDMRELKEIGWDLINIATDAGRASAQIAQAEAKPGNAKEEREALAAYRRLVAKCEAATLRTAQYRSKSWPP